VFRKVIIEEESSVGLRF